MQGKDVVVPGRSKGGQGDDSPRFGPKRRDDLSLPRVLPSIDDLKREDAEIKEKARKHALEYLKVFAISLGFDEKAANQLVRNGIRFIDAVLNLPEAAAKEKAEVHEALRKGYRGRFLDENPSATKAKAEKYAKSAADRTMKSWERKAPVLSRA